MPACGPSFRCEDCSRFRGNDTGRYYEQRSSSRRHAQRCVHSHVRRQAPEVGRQRPALWRLGDLPPEGLAGRSEPHLCLANQQLVRADHSALRRRRQNVAPAGHAGRRADDHARRHAEGREQQVRLRHVAAERQAAHDAPVVRRHAASVGVQARLASGAVAHRSRHGLRRRGRRGHLSLDRRRQESGTSWPACAATAPGRSGRPAPAAWGCTRSSSIRRIPTACSSPSPRPARSAPTTAARRGSRSIAACARSTFPIRMPRSATACIASRCTRRGRTCCSCRSIGT